MKVTQEMLRLGARDVETLLAEPARPAFALVYVHGHGFDAAASLPLAWHLVQAGGLVLLVSQPGYGRSTGPPDYCGPATVAAVLAAAESLRARLGPTPALGIWGFSRGAIVTGQAIRARPDLFAAAVLQGGGYDLARDYEMSRDEGLRRNLMKETGGDPAALRQRSLIHHVREIRCRVLVLHGESDGTYLPENAARLVAALARERVVHEHRILAGEHELPWPEVVAAALPFLDRHLVRAAR